MNNDDLIILEKKMNLFNEKYDIYKNNNKIYQLELKEVIYDILDYFEICLKRVKKIPIEYEGIISGIKYANNVKKHSKSIFEHTLKTTALFPSNNLYPSNNLFPSDFKIWWNELPLDNNDFMNQYKNYKKHLEGQDVKKTLNDIYTIIKSNYNYYF